MSKEYIAPAVVLRLLTGTGTRVSKRSALSAPASPRVWPWLSDWPPPLLPLPPLVALLPPLFTDGPAFCACPADRTSKEASNPMPMNLPHRAMGLLGDTSRLLDILVLPHTASRGRHCPKERHFLLVRQFLGPCYIRRG